MTSIKTNKNKNTDNKQNSVISNKRLSTKKIAVITGVSRGMGKYAALKLIELGYIVIGCARNVAKIQELRELTSSMKKTSNINNNTDTSESKLEHDFSVVDITVHEQVRTWAERVITKYGSPHILINNAGAADAIAFMEDISIETFNTIIDVNVKGVFYVCKYFMPAMKANVNRESKIITISSLAGTNGYAKWSPYCSSKWAIEGFMRCLANEVPNHMMCCPYNPGSVITSMLRFVVPELEGKIDECIAMGAIGAQQWAHVCIPHILSLNRDEHNGKTVDRPQCYELLNRNWIVYEKIRVMSQTQSSILQKNTK